MVIKAFKVLALGAFVLFMSACSAADKQFGTSESYTEAANKRFGLSGYYILKFGENANVIAGLYGKKAGASTASGERYDPASYTAAHKSLPFNTIVRISNLANGRSTEVRINDRVSNADRRAVLLSQAAANDLDIRANAHINLDIVAFALFSPNAKLKTTFIAPPSEPQMPSIRRNRVQNLRQSVENMPQTTPQTASKPAKQAFAELVEGEILVQIGAYRNQSNADLMQELYAKFRKYRAFTQSCLDERLHCVYLRGFDSVAEARYFIQTSPTWDNFILIDGKVLEYSGRKDEPRDIYRERALKKRAKKASELKR